MCVCYLSSIQFENVFVLSWNSWKLFCQMALNTRKFIVLRLHTHKQTSKQTKNNSTFFYFFNHSSGFSIFSNEITSNAVFNLTFDFISILVFSTSFIILMCECVFVYTFCLFTKKIQWKNIFCSIIVCFCLAPFSMNSKIISKNARTPPVTKLYQLNWFKNKTININQINLPRSKLFLLGKSIFKKGSERAKKLENNSKTLVWIEKHKKKIMEHNWRTSLMSEILRFWDFHLLAAFMIKGQGWGPTISFE